MRHDVSGISPAVVLLNILKEKWKLQHGEKDMIVMHHRFVFEKVVSENMNKEEIRKEIHSTLKEKKRKK